MVKKMKRSKPELIFGGEVQVLDIRTPDEFTYRTLQVFERMFSELFCLFNPNRAEKNLLLSRFFSMNYARDT